MFNSRTDCGQIKKRQHSQSQHEKNECSPSAAILHWEKGFSGAIFSSGALHNSISCCPLKQPVNLSYRKAERAHIIRLVSKEFSVLLRCECFHLLPPVNKHNTCAMPYNNKQIDNWFSLFYIWTMQRGFSILATAISLALCLTDIGPQKKDQTTTKMEN